MYKKLPEITISELLEVQAAGGQAYSFQANDFFIKHLRPAIKADYESAQRNSDWSPANTWEMEKVALCTAYNSGLRRGLMDIEVIIKHMITRGEEASKEIEKRKAREAK